MSGLRQEKVSGLIKKELSSIFQQEGRSICLGAMVTVTVVRVTSDMSLARVYLSIFGHSDKTKVFESIESNKSGIRGKIARTVGKNMRKVPHLAFFIDDSLDYAEQIDNLLKT